MRGLAVRLLRRVLGDRYERVRASVLGQPLPRPRRARARLLRSGLFDAGYFAALSRFHSGSRRRLALEWAERGTQQDLPFHPLIEVEFFPRPVRAAVRSGHGEVLLDYLAGAQARTHAWGPLFDPRRLEPGEDPIAAIRALRRDSLLPPPTGYRGEVRAWGAVRDHMLAVGAAAAEQRDRRTAPLTASWDHSTESAWVATVQPPRASSRPGVARVSIVMPAWNRADTLGRAIDSVRQQSYPDWQLIVVDDGSTDETLSVAKVAAAQEPRIRVIAAAHVGVSAARNLGIEVADGEFLAFLDSDNAWLPRYLELSLAGIDRGGDAAVYSAVELTDGDGVRRFRGAQVGPEDLQTGNSIDANCLVVRTSLVRQIGGFDESLRRWVDHDLVLRISAVVPLRFLPFLGCRYRDVDQVDRITNSESGHWQFVALGNSLVDWQEVAAQLPSRVVGRTSIVMLTYQDHQRTFAAVNAVLATTSGIDCEVILIDNGSRPSVGRILAGHFMGNPRVSYLRLARNYNFAIGCNVGFARSTGETVMFLNNDTVVRGNWQQSLLRRLESSSAIAVQPLLVYPDGTIQTAGTVFPVHQGLPCHFLPRHPIADAVRHDGEGFSAVTAGAMMLRASTFAAVRGFDPLFVNGLEDVDFCLRAAQLLGGSFAVESSAIVVHEESASPGRFLSDAENRRLFLERWHGRLPAIDSEQFAKIGLSVVHTTPETDKATGMARPLVARAKRTVGAIGESAIPSLRWALKIGADFTVEGDRWGDVPFARDLSEALGALGQDVVVDRRPAFGRSTAYLDDVVLAIRGAAPVHPQAGRTNVLWVISRPEEVTPEELSGYDLVFAASAQWAEWMTATSGRQVQVLLQATNPRRFALNGQRVPDADPVVFVGGARPPTGRQIVADVSAAGLDFAVWGPGWDRFVEPSRIRGVFLDHDESATVYRSAALVLNDHLPGMAEWGFVSNRIFDAVACGSRVVTDTIAGLDDLFGTGVRAYSTVAELRDLITHPDDHFPTEPQMKVLAQRIAHEHSFDRRAETLLDAVLRVRRANEPV